jgi:hypothetical protein
MHRGMYQQLAIQGTAKIGLVCNFQCLAAVVRPQSSPNAWLRASHPYEHGASPSRSGGALPVYLHSRV